MPVRRPAFPFQVERVAVLSGYHAGVPVVKKQCKGPCGQSKSAMEFYNDASQPDGKTRRCIACIKGARKKGPTVAGKAPMKLSDEERRRRSEQAKAQVEAGEIGGVEHGSKGGRPRVSSLTERVLDGLREEADEVFNALRRGLTSDDERIAVRAVQVGLELEGKTFDREIKLKQGKAVGDMTRDELIDAIARGVAELHERGELPDDVTDAEAFEVTPAELPVASGS